MMNYEIFKEVVAEKFKDYLPEEYRDMELLVHPVEKVNRTLDGLNLISGEKGITASPTIYINDMYEYYQQCGSLQNTLQSAAAAMEQIFKEVPQIPSLDTADVKDHIIFRLVNTEQNRELLKTVPSREFEDLSIIYCWVIKMDEEGIRSSIVKNDMAKRLGMSEEQLFHAAAENTRRILPPTVESLNDIVCKMMIADGVPKEMAEEIAGKQQEISMWIISNDRKIQGSASMLYEDKPHTLAEQLGTDLYILPSSVNEVIAVPADEGDPNLLDRWFQR